MAATVIDGKAAAARLRASVAQEAATLRQPARAAAPPVRGDRRRQSGQPRLCPHQDQDGGRGRARGRADRAAGHDLDRGAAGQDRQRSIAIRTPTASWSSCRCREQIDDAGRAARDPGRTRTSTASTRSMSAACSRPGRELPDDLLVPCTPYGCLHLLRETPGRPGARRQGGGHRRPLQHRRQADGGPAAGRRLHGHHRPFAHPRPARGLPPRRHPGGGLGRPEFIRGAWIKPGATVIDVGINRVTDADGQEPAGRRRRLRARPPRSRVRSPRSRAASGR